MCCGRAARKLGIESSSVLTVVSGTGVVRKETACRGTEDPRARDARKKRGVPECAEVEGTPKALVGGVQDFEAGRAERDEAMDADERGPCSRGTAAARTLDCGS